MRESMPLKGPTQLELPTTPKGERHTVGVVETPAQVQFDPAKPV